MCFILQLQDVVHHVLFLQQHLNQEEVLYLGFQNEAKTQNQMSKMQNPNLGFFFFQILPFFLDVNVEFLKIKYYLF